MIYDSWINYKQNKKGTSLSATFRFKDEVKLKVDTKENIQKRLDLDNNDELKDYLKKVEELELNSSNSFYKDGKRLGRRGDLKISKRNLTLRLKINTSRRISKEKILRWDDLDLFIAKGEYPKNDP